MSRSGSLDLIDEVKDTLEVMKKNLQIKPVKVKSMLEHLRSALEYAANDVYDYHASTATELRPKIYFPYGNKNMVDDFFLKKLKVKQPNSSPLYETFLSIQDFHTGEVLLDMMCRLTNDAKHRKPISLQDDETIKDITVGIPGVDLVKVSGNASVTINEISIDGRKFSGFKLENGEVENFGNGALLNFVITKDKHIKFHGVEYEVIPFIEQCATKIERFINTTYDILERN